MSSKVGFVLNRYIFTKGKVMNLNRLAREISKIEGGKKNLSIAQIKEVIKCFSITLFREEMNGAYETINRLLINGEKHVKKQKKKK